MKYLIIIYSTTKDIIDQRSIVKDILLVLITIVQGNEERYIVYINILSSNY